MHRVQVPGWALKTKVKTNVLGVKKPPFWKSEECKPGPRVLGQTKKQVRGKFLILQEKESGGKMKKGIF